MSLTKHSWIPICSRKKAMKEITEIRRDKAAEAQHNEMVRANERQRHLEKEAKFRDIIDRVTGWIEPDGTRVFPQIASYQDGDPKTIESVGIRYDHQGDSLIFYARVSQHFIKRYGSVLTPSDIQFVCKYAAERIGHELATVMISGKVE